MVLPEEYDLPKQIEIFKEKITTKYDTQLSENV